MIKIEIDKETQKMLNDIRNNIITLNKNIQNIILTYIRAKGHPSDLNYNVSDDFSLIEEIKE